MAHSKNALGALVADILGKDVMLETKVADRVFQIDPRELPNNAILDLLRYGTQRRFNDATGGSDKTAEDKHAKVEEMIAGYYEGVTSTRRAGSVVDELTKVMRQLAQAALKDQWPKEKYKARVTDAEAADVTKLLDAVIATNPEGYEKEAKARIEAKRAEAAKQAKLAEGLAALDL